MKSILSPMTGSVWKIQVQIGEEVDEGQEIVILESMKMEIPVLAEVSGIVKEIKISEGEFVNEDCVLVELE